MPKFDLKDLSDKIGSLFIWINMMMAACFVTTVSILLLWPIYLFSHDRARKAFHAAAIIWARCVMGVVPQWKMHVKGADSVDRHRHFVVISNHQSAVDILVALRSVPVPFRFLAKKELMSIPFLGWHMQLAGYIPVERNDAESRKAAVAKIREVLRNKISVLMFPEGTRSLDGEIQDFYPGAFKLAASEKVDILPVVIEGTGDAVKKKSRRVRKNCDFTVKFLEPIPVPSPKEMKLSHFIERTRQLMIKELAAVRASRLAGIYD